MAVCDAQYKFSLDDVGDSGCHSDRGVLSNSTFGKAISDGTLPFPQSHPLPGTFHPSLPYVIMGDEAFLLKNHIMRPFPGRNLYIYQSHKLHSIIT